MDQAEIGAALGVSQPAVNEWLKVNNISGDNAYPDNRVKVPKEDFRFAVAWRGFPWETVAVALAHRASIRGERGRDGARAKSALDCGAVKG